MRPLIADVREATAIYFDRTQEDLTGPKRSRFYARPRQIAMAVCRETTGASLPQIGRHFGGRDHTTVMHARRRVYELEPGSPVLRKALDGITLLTARICMYRHAETIENAAQLLATQSIQAAE